MQDCSKFDSIRPYTDAEAIDAVGRIAEHPNLRHIHDFLFPNQSFEDFKRLLHSAKGVYDFQQNVMTYVVHSIVDKTSAGLTYTGVENVKDGKVHLLLSNHRDIILDPAIIQIIFFDNGVSTTEIAVGDNLITSSFIEDITRSNRMIKVVRSGSSREKYASSTLLSEYMRERVASGSCSVWIAQRNGRAKNGIDYTEQGLLKMLEMSGSNDFVKDFAELSIVPVSISYQYEPCDFLKARELYIAKRGPYVKAPGEDLNSILTGVEQFKGHINFHFSPQLSHDEIYQCSLLDKNERFQTLAAVIDRKVKGGYKLWNNNFIAHDLLHNEGKYLDRYTKAEQENFIAYMKKGLSRIVEKDPDIDSAELEEIFLSIYAGPIS